MKHNVKYPVKQKLILANLMSVIHPCEKLCESFQMIVEFYWNWMKHVKYEEACHSVKHPVKKCVNFIDAVIGINTNACEIPLKKCLNFRWCYWYKGMWNTMWNTVWKKCEKMSELQRLCKGLKIMWNTLWINPLSKKMCQIQRWFDRYRV